MNKLIFAMAAVLLVAGCSSPPAPNAPIPEQPKLSARPVAAPQAELAYISTPPNPRTLPGEEMARVQIVDPPRPEVIVKHRRAHREVYVAEPEVREYVPAYEAPAYRTRHYSEYRQSAVLPSAFAGALIGAGVSHDSWSGAGRGALIGAGVGVVLDMFHQ